MKDKEKIRLVSLLKEELREHNLVDVTNWIKSVDTKIDYKHNGVVRSICYYLRKEGEYEVSFLPEKNEYWIYVLPKRSPMEKHPIASLIFGALWTVFAVLIGGIIPLITDKTREYLHIPESKGVENALIRIDSTMNKSFLKKESPPQ